MGYLSWELKEESFKKQGPGQLCQNQLRGKDENGPLDLAIWWLLVILTRLGKLKSTCKSFEKLWIKGIEKQAVVGVWCGAKEFNFVDSDLCLCWFMIYVYLIVYADRNYPVEGKRVMTKKVLEKTRMGSRIKMGWLDFEKTSFIVTEERWANVRIVYWLSGGKITLGKLL